MGSPMEKENILSSLTNYILVPHAGDGIVRSLRSGEEPAEIRNWLWHVKAMTESGCVECDLVRFTASYTCQDFASQKEQAANFHLVRRICNSSEWCWLIFSNGSADNSSGLDANQILRYRFHSNSSFPGICMVCCCLTKKNRSFCGVLSRRFLNIYAKNK